VAASVGEQSKRAAFRARKKGDGMEGNDRVDSEQAALWGGRAGQAWVEAQGLLDGMFRPFVALLEGAVAGEQARRVLDVGCGTGSTTRAVARRPGVHGTGIDISEPMLAAARALATEEQVSASFVCGDAESHKLEPASFDMIISRFGVMFFDDPVRAFANLRGAASHGAALRVIAWRGAGDNPFMTTAERAAAPLLPGVPIRRADGPGQFAFADPERVRAILEQSGWTQIDIRPLDVACSLPEAELLHYVTRVGPLALRLPELAPEVRDELVQTVRAAFEPFVHGAEVRFQAACWDIGARAPSPG
jgi:SAM-dependent methyltransferase